MSTKSNPGLYDCYAHAAPDEEMFILLGRDRHASALVRLWALMREKEGESPEVVAEAVACAERLEATAREKGKIPMPIGTLLALATSLSSGETSELEESAPASPPPDPLKEGDIVVAGRSAVPARLVKVFGPDDPEAVRGKANIRLPRSQVPTTVDASTLRKALPEEVQNFRAAGGR